LSSQPFPAVGFLAGRVFDVNFARSGVFDFRFAGNLAFVIIAGLVVPERGGTIKTGRMMIRLFIVLSFLLVNGGESGGKAHKIRFGLRVFQRERQH